MKLLVVGDVMLGRLVNEELRGRPPAHPWGDTLPLFEQADLRLCNLECAMTDAGTPWAWPSKAFHFGTDERNVRALLAARFDIVSLANNHILDYGEAGMTRTIELLDASAIGHAGAGSDFEQAAAPAERMVGSARVGVIAFTDNEPGWAAGRSTPGTFFVPLEGDDPEATPLLAAVRTARSRVDVLVVSAHWGPNWGDEPAPGHVRLGHALIDSGADIVFGHSGHIVRGVEIYRQRPILYCAGDFVDDYAVDPVERNDRSSIFMVEARRHGVDRILIYPTVIRDFQARRASGGEAIEILRRLQGLCQGLGTMARLDEQRAALEIEIAEGGSAPGAGDAR
jgi:poly-gamma-glutamate capsule biosynthesis protein CapA/YwtB (metallophosphatase superfamily)